MAFTMKLKEAFILSPFYFLHFRIGIKMQFLHKVQDIFLYQYILFIFQTNPELGGNDLRYDQENFCCTKLGYLMDFYQNKIMAKPFTQSK